MNQKEIVPILDVSLPNHQQNHEGATTTLNHRSNRGQEQEQEQEEKELQKRLWHEDVTLCPKEEIAEFLGSPK